jgi:hypothetical protein
MQKMQKLTPIGVSYKQYFEAFWLTNYFFGVIDI